MTRSGSTPSPKLQLFAAFAGVARALGNPHRLDLLEHLAQGEKPGEALAGELDVAFVEARLDLVQQVEGRRRQRREREQEGCRGGAAQSRNR